MTAKVVKVEVIDPDGSFTVREYDENGRCIYYRTRAGYEEWYNPDAPSGQQTIRASAWDGCHDISYPQGETK